MKRIFLFFLLICLPFCLNAQYNKVEIGTIDTVYSKILNEKRPIWVYIPNPDPYGLSTQTKNEYPVLYLLDGEWHFPFVVGMIHQLSSINGNSICPEMIIVGIANIDRMKDFTPSLDSTVYPNSGGNEKFISFIEKELIPYIDSKYNVKPYRMLIGHSAGGLAVMNTLVNHTNLFNAYIAIEPSMWWNKQSFLKETEKILFEKKFDNINLFVGVANTMAAGMDTIKVKEDTSRSTLHIRSALELAKYLNRNKQNALNYKYKYYDNESHASVPLIATYDALHFLFSFYNLPLTYKDFADTSMALAYKTENHYEIVSKRMGYKVSPPEITIYSYAIAALLKKDFVKAKYFFELNIKNYPESFNAYDSFGDYYIAINDESNAIDMFNKALSVMENPETRKKIEKFQNTK